MTIYKGSMTSAIVATRFKLAETTLGNDILDSPLDLETLVTRNPAEPTKQTLLLAVEALEPLILSEFPARPLHVLVQTYSREEVTEQQVSALRLLDDYLSAVKRAQS